MSADVMPSEYTIMDEADNQQIQNAESAIKQALAYESRGKKQLSYMGIKWIVLKMSQKEQALEVLDLPCVELMKHDPDNQQTWVWYCTIKARNTKTGLVTVGASEATFLEKGKYDSFGRTKAISKAERNAYRKQIPEIEINTMLETIGPNDIQKLNSQNAENTPKPTNVIEKDCTCENPSIGSNSGKCLKCGGKEPEKNQEHVEDNSKDDTDDYEKYCTGKIGDVTHNFIPNGITNGKTCQTCNKLAPREIN